MFVGSYKDNISIDLFMTTNGKLFLLQRKNIPCNKNKRIMNPEFTTAIRGAKLIKVCAALMPPDRKRFYRLSKFILHHVIHADVHHKIGERMLLTENLQVFKNYEFDPDHPFEKYMPGEIILHESSISIPQLKISWPLNNSYCKIFLVGVSIDFQAFTTSSVIQSSEWLTRDSDSINLELKNTNVHLIAIGIAFTKNKSLPVHCQAVKIIDVHL